MATRLSPMTDHSETAAALTRRQVRALRLLARGGARYGTMHAEMTQLRNLELAYAHDTGREGPGRWTWRPTPSGRAMS